MDGAGTKAAIKVCVKQIRAQIEGNTSDYDREKLQEPPAKTIGGVNAGGTNLTMPRPWTRSPRRRN
ncbi:MAG: hypothetical protein ACLFUE_11375 [Desulfobacteraceae bacterium]